MPMENFAHTLFGLSLAKAGLERATPLAATALIISSSMPDIDVVMGLIGGTPAYLTHHRGLTHSFIGVFALAVFLTMLLSFFDRRLRLRRNAFLRPTRPMRLFALSCLGGLGHLFMDYTNSYGVRPLLPMSERWFYGDLAFVLDPWLWLILGSSVVWLTASNFPRSIFWLAAGALASLLIAMAAPEPTPQYPLTIPLAVRVIWFSGLAVVIAGALLRWGRAGEKLARYSLLVLALYYGGLWLARQEAVDRAKIMPPAGSAAVSAVWPTPANPFVWQAVSRGQGAIYTRYIDIVGAESEWRESVLLDAKFVEALGSSPQASTFLWFSRFATASVEEQEDGYSLVLRDVRFDLRMKASLDRDLKVRSVDVRWH
jgi:inner membrane protein